MILAQAVSSYFFWDEPKQFFAGAELCARWFIVLKGDAYPKTLQGVIDYSQQAQEILSWILAGRALSILTGRVARWQWDGETATALSDSFSQVGACGDIFINKLFESKVSRFKALSLMGDTFGDLIELKKPTEMVKTLSKSVRYISAAKSITSLFLTVISWAVYRGAQTYFFPRIFLVIETTVFMTKLASHCIYYQPEKSSQ